MFYYRAPIQEMFSILTICNKRFRKFSKEALQQTGDNIDIQPLDRVCVHGFWHLKMHKNTSMQQSHSIKLTVSFPANYDKGCSTYTFVKSEPVHNIQYQLK